MLEPPPLLQLLQPRLRGVDDDDAHDGGVDGDDGVNGDVDDDGLNDSNCDCCCCCC